MKEYYALKKEERESRSAPWPFSRRRHPASGLAQWGDRHRNTQNAPGEWNRVSTGIHKSAAGKAISNGGFHKSRTGKAISSSGFPRSAVEKPIPPLDFPSPPPEKPFPPLDFTFPPLEKRFPPRISRILHRKSEFQWWISQIHRRKSDFLRWISQIHHCRPMVSMSARTADYLEAIEHIFQPRYSFVPRSVDLPAGKFSDIALLRIV